MTTFTVTITTDGTAHVRPMPEDTLQHLQAEVDGYIEAARLAPGLDLWTNEEALLMGAPANPVASTIASAFTSRPVQYHGAAVFTGGADEGGRTAGLDAEAVRRLIWAADIARDPRRAEHAGDDADLRDYVGHTS